MGQFRDFFRMGPYRKDHFPALRGAVGIAVPLLILLVIGRPDLSLFAIFGAFSGVYGRMGGYRERLTQQSLAGLVMALTVLVSLWIAESALGPWVLVLLTAVMAAGVTVLATVLRFGPVAGFFAIFAFASISHSAPVGNIALPLLINVGASVLAVLLGISGALFRRGDRPWRSPEQPHPIHWPQLGVQAARYFIGVVLAGSVATLFGLGHSYWAMISAAVVMMGADRWGRVIRGVHRVVGTFGGLLIFWLLSLLDLPIWQIVILLVLLQFLAEFVMVRHYGLAMIFITPLALTMMSLAPGASTQVLITDRAWETLLGAALGMLVAWTVHEPSLRNLQKRAQRG